MIVDIKKEVKNAVIKSQHTQRNWDLSREIPQDDVDLLVHAITNCPSKQNMAFYNAHVITDRALIEQCHELATGLGVPTETGERLDVTNPQVLANVLIAFEKADLSDRAMKKWQLRDGGNEAVLERDINQAVGIAAGYLNVTAAMLGYATGCCACGDFNKIQEVLGLKNKLVLLMGVGFKDPNRQRREHHTAGVMIPRRPKEEIQVTYK